MIQRTVPALLLAASLTAALAGCVYTPFGGPRVTEDRDIDDVTALVLKTGGNVVVTLGETPSLTIKASSAIIDRLTSDVDGDVLTLDISGPHLGLGAIEYALTVTSLSDVTIDGSGDVDVDFTGADEVRVAIDGSGDIDGTGLDATTVESSIEGSGDIELVGSADERATVSISGSGDVDVFATETLDARISGSGQIRHRGGAKVSSDVSGSGDVVEDD